MPGNYHRGSIWPPNSRMNLFIPRRQTISPTDAVRATLATPMSAQKLPQNDDFVHSRIRSTILSLILRICRFRANPTSHSGESYH